MMGRHMLVALLVCWVLGGVPATRAAAPDDQAVGPPPPELSPVALANATYRSEYTRSGTATLANGEYVEATGIGATERVRVVLTDRPTYGLWYGLPVAAVVLTTSTGGTGNFHDLALVTAQAGRPVHMATAPLGDRVQVGNITIADNLVIVEMVQAGPNDPACCPTQRARNTYALQLMQRTSVVLGTTSGATTLLGTTWNWQRTLMNDGTRFEPGDPTRYTLELRTEGGAVVRADCNRAQGAYRVEGQRLTFEPLGMTRAFCGPEALDTRFVGHLQQAAIYRLEGGTLTIDLPADAGTMVFTAASGGSVR